MKWLRCFLFHGKHHYYFTDYGMHDHYERGCAMCERKADPHGKGNL